MKNKSVFLEDLDDPRGMSPEGLDPETIARMRVKGDRFIGIDPALDYSKEACYRYEGDGLPIDEESN